MSEWQPIETAPKDGTAIDVWAGGKRCPDVYWSHSVNADTGEPISSPYDCWAYKGQYVGIGGVYPKGLGIHEPTHWMPLPEPPKG